ncbi:MAG: ABC transporter substrate-binding protein [Chloroflexota bacterium]
MYRSVTRWLGMSLLLTVSLAGCSPPLAASPTAAPAKPAPPTSAPAAPSKAEAPAKPAETPAAPKAAADPLDESRAKYYEAAKAEGKLVLYGVGPKELWDPLKDAFQKRFPGIELEGVDQRGRESREKVFAEQRGRAYAVDIVISGFSTQNELVQENFVEAYRSPFASDIRPELAFQSEYLNSRSAGLLSLVINTSLVPPDQEPKTWKDILDPKWRGKIAMDDPRGSGPGNPIMAGLDILYGDEFLQKLAEQKPFFATQAGPLLTGLTRGEYALYLSGVTRDIVKQRQSGAPVKYVKLADGVGISQNAQALIKNAPHPNAAKLWLDWSLSEEGQQELSKQGDGPVRKGVRAQEFEADLDGVALLPRVDTPEQFKEIAERTKKYERVFFSGS